MIGGEAQTTYHFNSANSSFLHMDSKIFRPKVHLHFPQLRLSGAWYNLPSSLWSLSVVLKILVNIFIKNPQSDLWAKRHVTRSKGNSEVGRGNSRRAREGVNALRFLALLNTAYPFPFERSLRWHCSGTCDNFKAIASRCCPSRQLMHYSGSFRVFFDELESNFVTCTAIINILVC